MKRRMMSLLAVLAALVLLTGTLGAAQAEGEAAQNTAVSASIGKVSAKTVTLKRGKTLQLWVYPFASTTQFYKDCGKEYPVGSIKFSGTKGTVKAKVTSGSSWLKAKKTKTGWTFTVTGKNLTTKDKRGVIKITDAKGTFAFIRVTRGGTVLFSKIYSVGSAVYGKIKGNSAHTGLYGYRWIFDRSKKLVSKQKVTYTGKEFRDVIYDTHLGYTYVYTMGITRRRPAWGCRPPRRAFTFPMPTATWAR